MTANFYQVVDQFRLVIAQVGEQSIANTVRETLWLIMDNELRGRVEVSETAREYVEQCYKAFLTATPIVTSFQVTAKRQGD